MTHDHSWVEEQVRAGTMSATAARQHPWRNVVTRALSGGEDPEVDVTEVEPQSGRSLPALLGRPVRGRRRPQIAEILGDTRAVAAGHLRRRLIDAANAGGGPDNITALVLEVNAAPMAGRSMFHNLARLTRYRGLIQSLVARELKARYRGSVLGFFWSFINPLLLLLVYSFVFKYVLPRGARRPAEPYALFMFCGILPWTWFSSSLLESSGVLISGGNLIKKVLFPAEVLPIVTVLANMVHFFLGLPILAGFLALVPAIRCNLERARAGFPSSCWCS